jgi:prepilin-type N-terminal cleavage/methylation domain-containing protein
VDAKRHRRDGLTLIEVLATTALLSLVAAALMGSFGGVTDRARVQALLHDLGQVDARARLHARMGTSVALAVDPARRRLFATARPSGERLSELTWPDDCEVKLVRSVREPLIRARGIFVEAGGCSVDYTFEVKTPLGNDRIEVSGLTGWTSVAEGPR